MNKKVNNSNNINSRNGEREEETIVLYSNLNIFIKVNKSKQ
jgi:hypothetical protein